MSPLKRHHANYSTSYPATKTKEIQNVISSRIDVACSSKDKATIGDEMSSEDGFSQSLKILKSLIDRYKVSDSSSRQITILLC